MHYKSDIFHSFEKWSNQYHHRFILSEKEQKQTEAPLQAMCKELAGPECLKSSWDRGFFLWRADKAVENICGTWQSGPDERSCFSQKGNRRYLARSLTSQKPASGWRSVTNKAYLVRYGMEKQVDIGSIHLQHRETDNNAFAFLCLQPVLQEACLKASKASYVLETSHFLRKLSTLQ